jgi:hypothetical protein
MIGCPRAVDHVFLGGLAGVLAAVVATIAAFLSSTGTAFTQPASGVIADGNAAVTGFSGAQVPTLIAPGVNPDKITIDLNGPSMRVIDLAGLSCAWRAAAGKCAA